MTPTRLRLSQHGVQAELFATREKNGIYVPAELFDAREKTSLFMSQRVEALEAELEAAKEAAQQELVATREAAAAAAERQAASLTAAEQVLIPSLGTSSSRAACIQSLTYLGDLT